MKTLTLLAISSLFTIASAFAEVPANEKPKAAVKVQTDKYAFVFKADKELLGATIEVFDSNNKLTGKEILFDRKMVIDFFYMPADTYHIKITKDNETLEFEYVKTESLNP